MKARLLDNREPPDGFDDKVLQLVTFAVVSEEFDEAIVFSRGVKGNDDKWRNYKTHQVSGGAIKFFDVPLCKGHRKDGQIFFYLNMPNCELPREVKDALVKAALESPTDAERGKSSPAGGVA